MSTILLFTFAYLGFCLTFFLSVYTIIYKENIKLIHLCFRRLLPWACCPNQICRRVLSYLRVLIPFSSLKIWINFKNKIKILSFHYQQGNHKDSWCLVSFKLTASLVLGRYFMLGSSSLSFSFSIYLRDFIFSNWSCPVSYRGRGICSPTFISTLYS